jgi:dTDP-4-amino-4,6-dideoxygalactose transaminase
MPFLDLKAQFAPLRSEILQAVARVLDSQKFILGNEVEQFEQEIASYIGCKHAIGCASGSDALVLALMALEIGPGDEVITSAFTFGATAGAIARVGALPVFVDINPETFNIDADAIAEAITPQTRAIMPVHLFGLTADMAAIGRVADAHNLVVIEDAAQAIGAMCDGIAAGNIGTIGCFSFFPSKNLGCAGDGGLVTTSDTKLAENLRMLRAHGCRRKYHYDKLGMNSRLDALQAAILRVKLPHLDHWAARRAKNAEFYIGRFRQAGVDDAVKAPLAPEGYRHVYNQFTIQVSYRDQLRSHLSERGIPTEVYYPAPLHLQPAFASLGYSAGDLPATEVACKRVVSLPIFAELTEHEAERVADAVIDFCHGWRAS